MAAAAAECTRFCLTDTPGFNPPGIPAGGVGFDSPYRCGYGFVSPSRHPGAKTDLGPSAIRQAEPLAAACSDQRMRRMR